MDYKYWLFDGDGVLYQGKEQLPGSIEILEKLDQLGKKTVLITNNSTSTLRQYEEKLEKMGLSFDFIVTSAYTTLDLVDIHSAFVIGEEGIFDACRSKNVETDPSNYDVPEAVIVGMDRAISYEKLSDAIHYILNGARFLATNPDVTFPRERRIGAGAGTMIGAISAGVGREPELVAGKPNHYMFAKALRLVNGSAEASVMIGDRFDTDILGASRQGIDTALVRTGIATGYSDEMIQGWQSDNLLNYVYHDLLELIPRVV